MSASRQATLLVRRAAVALSARSAAPAAASTQAVRYFGECSSEQALVCGMSILLAEGSAALCFIGVIRNMPTTPVERDYVLTFTFPLPQYSHPNDTNMIPFG